MAHDLIHLIGNTPLLRLGKVDREFPGVEIYGKAEYFNPGGSVKDRAALNMILEGERAGLLRPGKMLIDSTSGNTGIAYAMICAMRGYKVRLCLPQNASPERKRILKAYGAELILTPGPGGMKAAVEKAEELARADSKYFLARQFDNPANPEIHRRTTALEVLEQVPELDAFVAGIGTGGTITGVGEVLAQKKPGTLVVAVEPETSPLLTKGVAGPNKIQGIGANFIPSVLNREAYTRVEDVSYEDAVAVARLLTRKEGLFSGISTGAIVHAAIKVAVELGKGKTVVAVLCDTGERYLSHPLYAEIDGPVL